MRYFAWLLNIVANDDKRRLVLFRIMGVKNSSIWNSKRKTLDLHLKSNKSMDDWNFGNSRIDSVMVEIKQGILKFSGFHGWSPLVVIYDKSKVVQNFFHFWITNIRSSLDSSSWSKLHFCPITKLNQHFGQTLLLPLGIQNSWVFLIRFKIRKR